MGKLAQKFRVPDELANLYEFANSLDLRCFMQHGVQHSMSDELANPRGLAVWMRERGFIKSGAKITPSMFETALQIRSSLRAFLELAPAERATNRDVLRSLSKATRHFLLVVEANREGEMRLRPTRNDAFGGLSIVVAELYDASASGSLDRLKMCAAQECRRVFFDRSKPGSRRWCLSTLCGNRMKTRIYRERHKNNVRNSKSRLT
jgi:predicted RNA-binding Zn ribbon-like protein